MRRRGLSCAAASLAAATTLILTIAPGRAAADRPASRTITVKKSGGDYTTIQGAIDAAASGDTILVYPGEYDEIAIDRHVLDGTPAESGPYTFGLFIGQDLGDLLIQGVDAWGRPIRDFHDVRATVTTYATNSFGTSGVFVEGDDVTIAGLDIGTNLASPPNKTIEVTGDGFALLDCVVSDPEGALYFGDWRFDEESDSSHIRRYRVEGNLFRDGVSVDLSNGAGYSGDVRSRLIRHNTFENAGYWPSISFNGSGTGVGWFVYSVGGAVIKNNSFVNTFAGTEVWELEREGHIRARGTYDNSQFDWRSYWYDNTYDHAYVVGPQPPQDLREYSYSQVAGSTTYVFSHVRRIGALLEGEQQNQESGDTILSK